MEPSNVLTVSAVILVVVLAFVAYRIWDMLRKRPMVFCLRCEEAVHPKRKSKGSFVIEVVAWLCFGVPGLLYSLWRANSRYDACPFCGADELVPLGSARVRNMMIERQDRKDLAEMRASEMRPVEKVEANADRQAQLEARFRTGDG